MDRTKRILATVVVMVIFLGAVQFARAQRFRVELNGYTANLSGDFTSKNMSEKGAGFVEMGFGSNLEFKYYYKKIGFGVRFNYVEYQRDNDGYIAYLKKQLGINGEDYEMVQDYVYLTYDLQFGLTYLVELSPKFDLEPYFYFGFNSFVSPIERAIYFKNNTTYTYRKKPVGYAGIGYVPGIKVHWKISRHFGLNLALEYSGVALNEDVEESLVYSYNSFQKTRTDKAYNPTSVNFGLGLVVALGKGW